MYCKWLRTNAISPQPELTKLYATADNSGAMRLPSAPTQPFPPPRCSVRAGLKAETGHFSIPHLLPFVNFLSRIFGPPAGTTTSDNSRAIPGQDPRGHSGTIPLVKT